MFETIQYLSALCITLRRHTNMLVAVISLKLWLRDRWTNCNVCKFECIQKISLGDNMFLNMAASCCACCKCL